MKLDKGTNLETALEQTVDWIKSFGIQPEVASKAIIDLFRDAGWADPVVEGQPKHPCMVCAHERHGVDEDGPWTTCVGDSPCNGMSDWVYRPWADYWKGYVEYSTNTGLVE